MTRATCHPDRPHRAHGLCNTCYARHRYHHAKVVPLQQLIPCAVCHEHFQPTRRNQKHCSRECYLVSVSLQTSKRRGVGRENEDTIITRDEVLAIEIIRTARGRGLTRIHPRDSVARHELPAYYSAWKRRGGLYLVRVRWGVAEEVAA